MMAPGQPGSDPKSFKVLLIDDHAVVRSGLERQINSERDLTVCAEAETAREAMSAVNRTRPDVVLVDISLRDGHGLELIKDLRTCHPELPILVFTMHDESLYAARCLRAGAHGYVMKHEKPRTLIRAIREVLVGHFHFSPAITRAVMSSAAAGSSRRTVGGKGTLTDRELEIFELIGRGESTKQIASVLKLAAKTVLSHRENIRRKLGLASSNELLRSAIHWLQEHEHTRRPPPEGAA